MSRLDRMDLKMIEKPVVIVGGGPAGIASAIWCCDLGLRTILLDSEDKFGGQLFRIHNRIANYPGIDAANGEQLRLAMLRTADSFQFEQRPKTEVRKIETDPLNVVLADGERIEASAIIISTGVRRRSLDAKGVERFRGKGVIESGVKAKDEVQGKNVLIVGGGDAAVENALILRENAKSVTVVHRRNSLSARTEYAEPALIDRKIRFLFNSKVEELIGSEDLEKILCRDLVTNDFISVDADAILIRIGVEPNSEIFAGTIDRDDGGYIITDRYGNTNVEGVYAVGDVANPVAPTIATAVGTAAMAAKQIVANSKKNMDILRKFE